MKTIFITGANRGIGLELTHQYLAAGWRVIACCRDPERADQLKSLKTNKENFLLIKLDVCRIEDIHALKQQLANECIDILLNNAGVYGSAEFGTIEAKEWVEIFRINTVAPLLIAQTLIQQVAKSELKIIANMSSQMGSIELNTEGCHYYYRSTKAALNAITKSLAIDLKKQGITVATLHPGWVQTDMGGPKAPIVPEVSAKGLLKVLNSLTLKDTAGFIRYDGEHLPW